jgi:hypothetical protein
MSQRIIKKVNYIRIAEPQKRSGGAIINRIVSNDPGIPGPDAGAYVWQHDRKPGKLN